MPDGARKHRPVGSPDAPTQPRADVVSFPLGMSVAPALMLARRSGGWAGSLEGTMILTIYFDGQFWVGVAEEETPVGFRACRHVFGGEPSDTEVFEFVNRRLPALFERSRPVAAAGVVTALRPSSPKRASREAARAVHERGASTRAQQVLRAEYESRKSERRVDAREARDARADAIRAIAREKAKAKHRGH